MKEWVSIDIETSGLDPNRHEIIEIGMAYSNGATWECSLEFDHDKADPKDLEVNGWGKRDFALLKDVVEVMRILHTAFHGGVMLVASPAHFDVGFLEALFRKYGQDPPWGHRSVIDIKSFACARFGVLTDLKNSEIARMLDLQAPSNKHTALADAMWQRDIFEALIR